MKTIKIILAIVCVSILGCMSSPNGGVVGSTAHLNEEHIMSPYANASELKDAIIKGAARRRWATREIAPGTIRCQLIARAHELVIDIKYTDTDFSIYYVSSNNMNYDPQTGEIHRKYRGWVTALKRSIMLQKGRK